MMDDAKSDITDDLLIAIEPLLSESEMIIERKDYKNNVWDGLIDECGASIILDDILSGRSADGSARRTHSLLYDDGPRSDIITSRTNMSRHYDGSSSAQTTPRNFRSERDFSVLPPVPRVVETMLVSTDATQVELTKCRNELSAVMAACSNSRIEVQRLQLTNRQLNTQLQEAKLSIQTLSVQLEQVQQECKQKENTLENLDNTLGKLVASWKKRDCQKDLELDNLISQLETKNRVIDECQRIADESRKALVNADKTVVMERTKTQQIQKNFGLEVEKLKSEIIRLKGEISELNKRCMYFETDKKKLKDICLEKENNLENTIRSFQETKSQFQKEVSELMKVIEDLRKQVLEQELDMKARDESLTQSKREFVKLNEELSKARKEGSDKSDTLNQLKMKMKSLSEEHNLMLKKMDIDFKNKVKQEVATVIANVNAEHKRTIQHQANIFHNKLTEQSKRHRLELEKLRQVAEQEITSRLTDSQETIAMLRSRLERSENSVKFWQQEKEVVEKARNQISATLYQVMKIGQPGTEKEKVVSSRLNTYREVDESSLIKPVAVLTIPQSKDSLSNYGSYFFEPIKPDRDSVEIGKSDFRRTGSKPIIGLDNFVANSNVLSSTVTTGLSF